MDAPRYAIYYVPGAPSALYHFGAAALGYDAYSGQDEAFLPGAPPDWSAIVATPRVYGFHATMKPPFRLADGVDERALEREFSEFANAYPAVHVGRLAVTSIGDFIALAPPMQRPLLTDIAASCVERFDHFRRPMEASERTRRLTPKLTSRQIGNLDRWGYPYVFEDFRFHMTLTGAVPEALRASTLAFLDRQFDRFPAADVVTIDQLVLSRQAASGTPFRVMQTARLGHSALRPFAYSC